MASAVTVTTAIQSARTPRAERHPGAGVRVARDAPPGELLGMLAR